MKQLNEYLSTKVNVINTTGIEQDTMLYGKTSGGNYWFFKVIKVNGNKIYCNSVRPTVINGEFIPGEEFTQQPYIAEINNNDIIVNWHGDTLYLKEYKNGTHLLNTN